VNGILNKTEGQWRFRIYLNVTNTAKISIHVLWVSASTTDMIYVDGTSESWSLHANQTEKHEIQPKQTFSWYLTGPDTGLAKKPQSLGIRFEIGILELKQSMVLPTRVLF